MLIYNSLFIITQASSTIRGGWGGGCNNNSPLTGIGAKKFISRIGENCP